MLRNLVNIERVVSEICSQTYGQRDGHTHTHADTLIAKVRHKMQRYREQGPRIKRECPATAVIADNCVSTAEKLLSLYYIPEICLCVTGSRQRLLQSSLGYCLLMRYLHIVNQFDLFIYLATINQRRTNTRTTPG